MPTAPLAKPPKRASLRTPLWRASGIAVGFGAVAGIVTAMTLKVMHWRQQVVWGVSDARWYVVAGLAATTVRVRKPGAALLIGLFVVHGAARGPLVVGVAVGVLVLRVLPAAASEHAGAAGTGPPPTTLSPV